MINPHDAVAVLDIKTFPDPVLMRPAEEVGSIDGSVLKLMDDMVETMYWACGAGLAAPQVGISKRIITIDVERRQDSGNLITLANPIILAAEGEDYQEEGCLSIPDFITRIHRFSRVSVQGLDREGKTRLIEAEGLLARALQHEIDHLNGVLIIDRLRGLKKEMARRKLRKRAEDSTSPS